MKLWSSQVFFFSSPINLVKTATMTAKNGHVFSFVFICALVANLRWFNLGEFIYLRWWHKPQPISLTPKQNCISVLINNNKKLLLVFLSLSRRFRFHMRCGRWCCCFRTAAQQRSNMYEIYCRTCDRVSNATFDNFICSYSRCLLFSPARSHSLPISHPVYRIPSSPLFLSIFNFCYYYPSSSWCSSNSPIHSV